MYEDVDLLLDLVEQVADLPNLASCFIALLTESLAKTSMKDSTNCIKLFA